MMTRQSMANAIRDLAIAVEYGEMPAYDLAHALANLASTVQGPFSDEELPPLADAREGAPSEAQEARDVWESTRDPALRTLERWADSWDDEPR